MPARKATTRTELAEVDPRFRPLVDAFSSDPRVSSGKMMASFGLRVDGKIFAMLVRGELVTKLPRERVDELAAAGEGRRFDPGHGRVMKEWFVLETSRLPWLELAREAHRFVGGEAAGARKGAGRGRAGKSPGPGQPTPGRGHQPRGKRTTRPKAARPSA